MKTNIDIRLVTKIVSTAATPPSRVPDLVYVDKSFGLSEIFASLSSHALNGIPEEGTAEHDIRSFICAARDSSAYEIAIEFGDDDIIVAAYRTPICKAKRGGFKDTLVDDLHALVLKALIDKTGLNPVEVSDIVVGTVLTPGSQCASECRKVAFYAGFPEIVPVKTVNRQFSSGLQAVADVAATIKAGFYDIGIGTGVESMTVNPMASEGSVNPKAELFRQAQDCLFPMGITSENVAERYGVSRQDQDQEAVESHRHASAATAVGKFKDEIIPVETKIDENSVTIFIDDGIRPNASLSDLGKLIPAFKKGEAPLLV